MSEPKFPWGWFLFWWLVCPPIAILVWLVKAPGSFLFVVLVCLIAGILLMR